MGDRGHGDRYAVRRQGDLPPGRDDPDAVEFLSGSDLVIAENQSMKRIFQKVLIALALGTACATPFAVFDPVNDDSDLFRNNPNIPSERPNVLIILDNTAIWTSASTNERAAFVSVVNALDSSCNVGWMMYPETGNPNDSIDGAYVRFAMRQMDSTNKAALSSIITAFNSNSDKGNNS